MPAAKEETKDVSSAPTESDDKWVWTKYGFGKMKDDTTTAPEGVSCVDMGWGTVYTPKQDIKENVAITISTFYLGGEGMHLKEISPGKTPKEIKKLISSHYKCALDEVRLVCNGIEVSGKATDKPLALLRFPNNNKDLSLLFVHETRYRFKLDPKHKGKHLILSSDGLTVSIPRHSGDQTVRGDQKLTKGKLYWDVHIDRSSNGRINVGVCVEGHSLTSYVGQSKFGWAYYGNNGKREHAGGSEKYGPTYGSGDTVRVMCDMDLRTLSFCKNGLYLGTAFHNIPACVYPAITLYTTGDRVSLRRFGTF